MKSRETEALATKQQRNRRDISLSNNNNDNYYSNTDNINPDQEDNFNLIQDRNSGR